ncbi:MULTISPECIES: protein-L-isoaspartate(D-aspartate) O-methyltransferase [Microvirgula]|nr:MULTISPECIES: protein-L-isoaspartate(D-aspartate) O-methyltransferase [Microvirgula]RAS19921.1 protein-L-isoaspartate(D-aspartate) O-methyltransferase [Microvirgula sp. AG722]
MADPLSLAPGGGYGMTSERTRRRMIDRLRENGIRDERVLAAMYEIPRHVFVDPALSSRAYDDTSLPLGHGQTISQPWTVARMSELLLADGRQPQKVLEIGTGCGYQTAVLARLIREVYSVERIGALLDRARMNLRTVKLVTPRLVHSDGRLGLIEAAPFDSILMAAAAPALSEELINQLAPGGRMVLPIGNEQEQYLWVVDKTAHGVNRTRYDAVKFVPLLPGKS